MKNSCVTTAILIAGLIVYSTAAALPRFSSRTGARCQSCHINPSGGGMRQTYGVQYGREELPVPQWAPDFEMEDFTNLVTNFLGLGADFRTLYYVRQVPDVPSNDAFYQMQGDFYLNFKPAKKVNLYLKKGLYSGFEIFGLLNILPARGFIKVGKFIPEFGTRLDDHTAYIRTYTGFSPELGRPELTGGEVGISPGMFSVTGGFYNASTNDLGSQNKKAYLGRAEGLFPIGEEMHAGLGANVFGKETPDGVTQTLYGGFGSFSYHLLTLSGEVDQIQVKTSSADSTGWVVYAEADYMVIPGLDLKVAYDFYDGNREVKNGSRSRYSFGVEFFPISGVEVRPVYRIVKESPVDSKNNEFDLLLHFYI